MGRTQHVSAWSSDGWLGQRDHTRRYRHGITPDVCTWCKGKMLVEIGEDTYPHWMCGNCDAPNGKSITGRTFDH